MWDSASIATTVLCNFGHAHTWLKGGINCKHNYVEMNTQWSGFDREMYFVVWRSTYATTKLNTEEPSLNLPIF